MVHLIPEYDELTKDAKEFGIGYILYHAPDSDTAKTVTSYLMKKGQEFEHTNIGGQHRFRIYV